MERKLPTIGATLFRSGEIVPSEDGSRTATFVASQEIEDRYGDIISVDGWKLNHFKKNPILLWGHQTREPPIGRVTKLYTNGDKLMADTEFMPPEINPFADSIWKMVKAKWLRAVSVGFRPLKAPEQITNEKGNWTGGYRFLKQELLELSVVGVPALPTALNVAKSLHVPERDYSRIFVDEESAVARHHLNLRNLELLKLRNVS